MKKMNIKIFMDLQVFSPLITEKWLFECHVPMYIYMYVCMHALLAPWTVGWVLFIFGIQELPTWESVNIQLQKCGPQNSGSFLKNCSYGFLKFE
jgi:hypothetical protein